MPGGCEGGALPPYHGPTMTTSAALLFLTVLSPSIAPAPAREDPPAGARWVEGRVERPADTPADEVLRVVADATGHARFGRHVVACAEDGRFRVAFGPDVDAGWLRLDARYAYLERDVPWRASEPAPEGGFRLAPRLGGLVRGTLRAPANEALVLASLRGRVALLGTPLEPGSNPIERDARVAADGTFECGGLAPDHEWTATFVSEGFVPLIAEGLLVRPGAATEIAWTLARGAVLRGRVVDEAGAPVADADVDVVSDDLLFVQVPAEFGSHRKSDARGEFVLQGVAAGRATITVKHADHWPAHRVVEGIADGEARGDLVIVLPSGHVLSGRVLAPDRKPAAGARVRVVQLRPESVPIEREARVGADGAFRFGGLYDGGVSVTAVLEVASDPVAPVVPVEGRAPAVASPPHVLRFRAALDGVPPDSRDLEVLLQPGLVLRGRVFDDLGRTVVRYKAGARRAVETDPRAVPVLIDVEAADGRFELPDLTPGEWDVFAYGRGIVYAPARRVTIPYTGEDLVFVVRRPARLAGVVLDAARAPVPKALVQVEWERAQLLGGAPATETTSVTAAPDGTFELTDVYPGAVRVLVTPVGARKSAPFPFDLASGETKTGVEIVLPP